MFERMTITIDPSRRSPVPWRKRRSYPSAATAFSNTVAEKYLSGTQTQINVHSDALRATLPKYSYLILPRDRDDFVIPLYGAGVKQITLFPEANAGDLELSFRCVVSRDLVRAKLVLQRQNIGLELEGTTWEDYEQLVSFKPMGPLAAFGIPAAAASIASLGTWVAFDEKFDPELLNYSLDIGLAAGVGTLMLMGLVELFRQAVWKLKQ
ncbi:MAG: hypothetical protein AABZ57_01755 [Candidatus Margulisiibacteriota bacterium]